MKYDIKNEISIKCKNNDEKMRIGNNIHEQLRGKECYINNQVILNIDNDKEILIDIFDDSDISEILIKL